MSQLIIGLGSNQGDRSRKLSLARGLCRQFYGPLLRVSPIYQTAAWGVEEQPDFLNQVIILETELRPQTCLTTAMAIENLMGRVRRQHWGPRVIDVDLLYYDDQIIDSPDLVLPHPRIQERNFVLLPLADIAGELVDPKGAKTINQLLIESKDPLGVSLYAGPS
ncbi:2-amino-4-hydroxy-6-hydroxymethyldihydropteridine diphosphokinase [Lewinellaceae bacterium SD302]|nr:2-amino-4-hydroxy-6-hydroxymethyldihydropteridine diphosphokinase [Lewinellaceae bacterium SD302]